MIDEIERDIEWLTSCEKCEGFVKSVGHNYCSNCGRELPEEMKKDNAKAILRDRGFGG